MGDLHVPSRDVLETGYGIIGGLDLKGKNVFLSFSKQES
jgi:hypothetical protein